MAKYKDYPVYTYDEPATYSDFSGGINTDPSNEHLQPNEMRDCLNMHYSSAALVKRKGASLLCTIECEEELFNIQGVFLFTYKITYIIIASDGKLYKGIYSPLAKIRLTKLPILIPQKYSSQAFDPTDVSVGLQEMLFNKKGTKHDGYIYTYLSSKSGDIALTSDNYKGDFINACEKGISVGDIVTYDNGYYKFTPPSSVDPDTLFRTITPTSEYNTEKTPYWTKLSAYNEMFKNDIALGIDPVSYYYKKDLTKSGLELDAKSGGFKVLSTAAEKQKDILTKWYPHETIWKYGSVVYYNDAVYICTATHASNICAPYKESQSYSYWEKLIQQKELIFQNHDNIESATHNNKLYIATGTRFVVVELQTNELVAHTVLPYSCSANEVINIGYNFLSPYPEACLETRYNQVITSISNILVTKTIYGRYILQPQMTFAQGESEKDYYFKWEKKVQDEWVTVYSYKNNTYKDYTYKYIEDIDGPYALQDSNYVFYKDTMGTVQRYSKQIDSFSIKKHDLFTIEVDDADKYQYRVSFAKSFENYTDMLPEWDYNKTYHKGDMVSVLTPTGSTEVYTCVTTHTPSKVLWDNCIYELTEKELTNNISGYYSESYKQDSEGNYINLTSQPIFSPSTSTRTGVSYYQKTEDGFEFVCYDTSTIIKGTVFWEQTFTEEPILTEKGVEYDWIVNKVDGSYFGQSVSVLASDLEINDTFTCIQTCKKITADGNKFLLYDDRYNSGSWYKTIIDNPTYITQRGSLSFKTNKNETLIKVIPFNGVLIAFANADNVGGSIHMITGNGDDWDDQSGYYSPYRRTTINVNVSCNNPNTVQVCENILVFKYFDTLYYIAGSELNNEVVSVYSCNDSIRHNNTFIQIPWEDNNCISEVTEDYYALIWKEQYAIDNGDLILERPALKIKMYYKLGVQKNEKIVYPWLRDESEYFNISNIIYLKGKPVYLYNNILITFNSDVYTDFDTIYKCEVHFRGEDLNYPKMTKFINNVLVYYHRNQYSSIDFDLKIRNEAGHILLDSSSKRISLQDLRAIKADETVLQDRLRVDSTILDSKVFNTTYKFPCLLADAIISSTNNKEFSISSITYNYITTETPDQTSYDLYSNILRPKEVK